MFESNCVKRSAQPGRFRASSRWVERRRRVLWAALLLTPALPEQASAAADYTLFESAQVRPLAMSPNGRLLFAVNTPDAKLEIFRIKRSGLELVASVPVGLEPVAVAARTNEEVWVVNHLSDSVSVVSIDGARSEVVRTLLVGDEPRDIVFAGRKGRRAFVTTAHRGQNSPIDPELTTPGVGRADVWVFDAPDVVESSSLGGEPLEIISLFADTPRALAVSPDGRRVYAAGFLTGNRTTVIPHDVVSANGGLPPPHHNFEGIEQPPTSLIVRFDGEHWVDEAARSWDEHVKFSLPDKDVFVIDAIANPPRPLSSPGGSYTGVGTVLYNVVVNPESGKIYVSNTEALNQVRFEGSGLHSPSTVRGHVHESRISVLSSGGRVDPRHLNKHVDYSTCCAPSPNDENAKSLATPMGMAVTRDGEKLYVAGFGSSKIGIFSTAELEADTFEPSESSQVVVSGGGPSGMVLDESRSRLYVLTRFNNAIAIIDTESEREIASVPMYTPEPSSVIAGRPFLYDASLTSSHGDTSCSSCHVSGDLDALSWDLGDPGVSEVNNPGPFTLTPSMVGSSDDEDFAPLKGPMATQSLRGLANHGPMHWRGDRTGGNDAPSAQPEAGTFDERAAFGRFNDAFRSLNGRHDELTEEQMSAFTDFVLQITYPPNPIRDLDGSLTQSQQAGRDFYFNNVSDRLFTCNGCHRLDPDGNADLGVERPGFFGTEGLYSFEFEPQLMKIPHFRNLYQKVGMFGMPPTNKLIADTPEGGNWFMGDQIRGFGFLHDGSNDTIFRFLSTVLFRFVPPTPSDSGNPGGFAPDPSANELQRRQVEDFLLAYDSNLAPIVGQQVTVGPRNWSQALERVEMLMARAELGECDLAVTAGGCRSYLYDGAGEFWGDRADASSLRLERLRPSAKSGAHLTFTCMPPGSGSRALDRDADGYLDGDELDARSDPSSALSVPGDSNEQ